MQSDNITSKVNAEGGIIGRRVLAPCHNQLSKESPEKYNDTSEGEGNLKTKENQMPQSVDEHHFLWPIKLRANILYVKLPEQLCGESKEKFISLLDIADGTLHCKYVIVSFDKTRSDRQALVKTFMFLDFRMLSPNNILMESIDKHPNQLFMVYIIDNDE